MISLQLTEQSGHFSRLGSPAHSAGDLSLPCRRGLRRAIHFFLLPIHFCGSQLASWLFPLACYWLFQYNDDREAIASSQLRTESFELGPLITPVVLKKMTVSSPDQRAMYDWAWSGNSQANTSPWWQWNRKREGAEMAGVELFSVFLSPLFHVSQLSLLYISRT